MLPNWLYGKSKSKLASILGGGSTPADYDEVKAQVTQNTEDIALLDRDSVTWDDLSEVGAVNYLDIKASTLTDATIGLMATVNDDKTVTISAESYPHTVPSTYIFNLSDTGSARTIKMSGNYKLTGCPSGGDSNDSYVLRINPTTSAFANDTGDGCIFNIPSSEAFKVEIRIVSGYELTGPLTFYPMITPVSYNGPYVPYSMTNRQLTEKLTADANLGTAVSLSAYTAYSKMYTAPSDGYVHFQSAASGSTARTIYTYGNNTAAAIDPHFTHSTSENNKAFEIYIRRGLKIYADGLQSGDTINFYPLT